MINWIAFTGYLSLPNKIKINDIGLCFWLLIAEKLRVLESVGKHALCFIERLYYGKTHVFRNYEMYS